MALDPGAGTTDVGTSGHATWEGRDAREWAAFLDLPAVEVHGSLPSTNDRAKGWAREGAPPWALVVADEQTAGRGRGSRAWLSPPGVGVWVSVIVPGRTPQVDALLPMRLGLALARRFEGIAGAPVGVKWPNDLFLGSDGMEGKVAGILCERIPVPAPFHAGSADRVVVGIGVNVHPVAVEAEYPPAHLASARSVGRGEVLAAVMAAVGEAASIEWPRLSEREQADWVCRDILAGRSVQVLGGRDGRDRGVARGIDAHGRLLVAADRELVRVVAGSVRLLEPVGDRRCGGR